MEKLTKVEEEIMHIIWQLDRCTVSDIIKAINKDAIPHSTISSVVRILEKKHYVDHKAYGRTYEYFPIISKEDYGKSSLKSLVKNYFEGSVDELVSFMVEEKKISLDELNELIINLKNNSK